MRLLELRAPGDPPLLVPLHPRVTVVTGLTPAERARLVDALDTLRTTRGAGLGGVVEAHGVLFDLAPVTLDLLDVPADLDLVVRAGELPGAVDAERDRARAALEREVAEAVARQERARGALDEAGEARRAAEAAAAAPPPSPGATGRAAEAASAALAGLRAQLERCRADRARAEASLLGAEPPADDPAAARAALVQAEADVTRLEAELAEARRELAAHDDAALAAPGPGPGPGEPAAATGAELETERGAVAAELERARSAEAASGPVREALDAVLGARSGPDPVAVAELAEEWRQLLEAGDGEAADVDPSARLEAARARAATAAGDVAALEGEVRPARMTVEERAALDQAHEAVIVAQERVDRSLVKGRPRRELEEVRRVEQELLSRFGFGSYSDYLLSGSMVQTDPAAEFRLATAKGELASAQEELDALLAGPAPGGELARWRADLEARTAALLGHDPGPDPLAALTDTRRSLEQHEAELADTLRRAGAGPSDGDPVAAARLWLGERDAARSVTELEAELAALDRRAAAPPPAPVAGPSPDEQARAALVTRIAALEVSLDEQEAVRRELAARVGRPDRSGWGPNVVPGPWVTGGPPGPPPAEPAAADERIAALQAAVAAEAEATATLRAAEADLAPLAGAAAAGSPGRAAGERSDPAAELAAALAAEAGAARVLADVAAVRRAVEAQLEELRSLPAEVEPVEAEDIEYYLLTRLAGQRGVSYAGSAPLVIDDILGVLDAVDVVRVLDRLERMADSVQLVLLSDRPELVGWAKRLPADRAALVAVRAAA
ncbi:MAG: hypothetical protein IPM45_16770 [Acidimicrobiales bacterium]|nr:hypothetical protein [Acidimicrobiales bacterium]